MPMMLINLFLDSVVSRMRKVTIAISTVIKKIVLTVFVPYLEIFMITIVYIFTIEIICIQQLLDKIMLTFYLVFCKLSIEFVIGKQHCIIYFPKYRFTIKK